MEQRTVGLFLQGSEVPVPLRGMHVEIELAGMLAHTLLVQRYRNASQQTIEAVYAFPVPAEGVLLGMEIDIAGNRLNGIVKARSEARNTYENAVTGGNGAFLLQQLREGLYQMNLGNLKPGEEAEIRIRHAEILRWSGNTLRYRLPTVVAPHYGDPLRAGIPPEDAPKTDLLAEYPLNLAMTVRGALAGAGIASPTHAVEIERGRTSTLVRLGKGAMLDRDFILNVSMSAPPTWEVLVAPDGDRCAALGCLNVPSLGDHGHVGGRDLTIVVDCSGSMSGDSIAQARAALLAILDELNDGDTLAVIRFGSTTDTWTPEPVTIDERQRERLRKKILTLEADLGGTEIMGAINKALQTSRPGADILLITDGEAHVGRQELIAAASGSHRFFTVGVGSAVSEVIVKTLATHSGGACELVTPNEHMAERIAAHARRMSMPRATLDIDWHAGQPLWQHQKGVVFAGDTFPVMAVMEQMPSSRPTVTLGTDNCTLRHETEARLAEGALAEALPRIVAWHRLNEAKETEAAREIAVRYQLVTQETSMVAILERAEGEQTDGLPTLAEVPQMLAAGWGGIGLAHMADMNFELMPAYCCRPPLAARCLTKSPLAVELPNQEVPSCLEKEQPRDGDGARQSLDMYELLQAVQEGGLDESSGNPLFSLPDLHSCMQTVLSGLPVEIRNWLESQAQFLFHELEPDAARRAVVLAFLAGLLDLVPPDRQRHFRALRRAVSLELRSRPLPERLLDRIADGLRKPEMQSWLGAGKPDRQLP